MHNLIITVPIFNEGKMTAVNTEKIYDFCDKNLNQLVDWRIVLTENGSSDNTFEIARKLEKKYPDRVLAYHFDNRGKANALKSAWNRLDKEGYKMDFISIMDIDIPFDMKFFLRALNEILDYDYDLVIGNRYGRTSKTSRPMDQIVVSKIYNFLSRGLLRVKIHDIQCGLKIFRYEKIEKYIPECDHHHGFFDLQIVKKLTDNGHDIKEISIDWDESRNRPTKFIKRKEIIEGVKTLFKLVINK